MRSPRALRLYKRVEGSHTVSNNVWGGETCMLWAITHWFCRYSTRQGRREGNVQETTQAPALRLQLLAFSGSTTRFTALINTKKEKLNKGEHLVHAPDTAASIKWLCHCNFHSFTLFAPVFDHRHILKSNLVYQALFTETLTFGTGTTRSLD